MQAAQHDQNRRHLGGAGFTAAAALLHEGGGWPVAPAGKPVHCG